MNSKKKNLIVLGSILGLIILFNFQTIVWLLIISIECLAIVALLGFLLFLVSKYFYMELFGPKAREESKRIRTQRKLEREEYHRNTFEKQNTWK